MTIRGKLGRAAFAALTDRQSATIRGSATDLPLFGPTGWSGPELLGDWSWEDDTLTRAGLIFGDPFGDAGPWIEVVTTRASAEAHLVSLRSAVAFESEPPRDEETYRRITTEAASPARKTVRIAVDDVTRLVRIWPDERLGQGKGVGWFGVVDGQPGLALTCSGMEPGTIRLHRVRDIEPFVAGSRAYVLSRFDEANRIV
nr:hypothetical protein [Micromonospora sp. DSM 115978]